MMGYFADHKTYRFGSFPWALVKDDATFFWATWFQLRSLLHSQRRSLRSMNHLTLAAFKIFFFAFRFQTLNYDVPWYRFSGFSHSGFAYLVENVGLYISSFTPRKFASIISLNTVSALFPPSSHAIIHDIWIFSWFPRGPWDFLHFSLLSGSLVFSYWQILLLCH